VVQTVLTGHLLGMLAGYFSGVVDEAIMTLADMQLAFPFILLAIAVLGVIADREPIHIILVLGIPGWIVYARVVRSRVLAEREKDYVHAARALGASAPRRLFRYVLPSTWQVVPVIAMLDVGFLVIMESTLSFLGLGLPAEFPSWGATLAEGRRNMVIAPWLSILPGLAIMLSSHSRVASSPSSTRMAVTNAWNEPLVGAQPMRPRHAGSVRSKTLSGTSSSLTSSVL
jgi:peptide/nickel transport system permease protein